MPALEYEVHDGVGTILLNRPEKRNAFTLAMVDPWVLALEEAGRDPEVGAVVLRGAGGAFCAGVDFGQIDEMGTEPWDIKEYLRLEVQRIPLAVQALDKPIIASVSGVAVGAGLDMALMCDLRLAGRSARFCESYVRAGFVPGAGGAWFLPRLVGVAKALELFMTGDFVDAEEAHRIGLVNRLHDDEELEERTYELASRLAAAPKGVMGMLKRTIHQSAADIDLRTALDLVSSHMGVLRSTPESLAQMRALQERVGVRPT